MTALVSRIRDMADRRARYARTVSELKSLPLDVALDLEIYPGDAEKIARAAVYGADAR